IQRLCQTFSWPLEYFNDAFHDNHDTAGHVCSDGAQCWLDRRREFESQTAVAVVGHADHAIELPANHIWRICSDGWLLVYTDDRCVENPASLLDRRPGGARDRGEVSPDGIA